MSSSELPLVSILAVSYNHESYCVEALDSILNQTYPNIQRVIVDDYSQDNTVQVIKSWINVNNVDCKFITHTENKGTCKTYNEGMSHCSGKYYSTLSCDDILLPAKTFRQVELFETLDDEFGMVYSDAEMFFEDDTEREEAFIGYHRIDEEKPSGDIFAELLERNFIPAMSCLIRNDVFSLLGGFDEGLLFEDYDFFLRLSKKYKVELLDQSFVKYRMHISNLHKLVVDMPGYHIAKGKMFLKHFEDPRAYEQLIALFKLGDLAHFQRREIEQVDLLRDIVREMNRLYHELLMMPLIKVSLRAGRLLGMNEVINKNSSNFQKEFGQFNQLKSQNRNYWLSVTGLKIDKKN